METVVCPGRYKIERLIILGILIANLAHPLKGIVTRDGYCLKLNQYLVFE